MPYPNPDQLVMVWSKVNGNRNGVSAGDFLDWKSQSTVFQSMCAWTGGNFALSNTDHPEMIQTRLTTPGFNDMVGTPFFLDGIFCRRRAGRQGTRVIMTHRLWMERFAATATSSANHPSQWRALHRRGRLSGWPADRLEAQLFVPLAFKPEQINHEFHFVLVMAA